MAKNMAAVALTVMVRARETKAGAGVLSRMRGSVWKRDAAPRANGSKGTNQLDANPEFF